MTFRVDGVQAGAPDNTAPFAISWDSSGESTGVHTVTAFASDAAGNTSTSNGITIQVNPTSSPGLANLWIDGDGGTCARSVSAVAYVDAAACSSMQAAMTAASGGDTVILACGAYGAQSITSGTKSSVVTFKAATYVQAVTASDAYSATTCATVANLSLTNVNKIHIYGIQATPNPDVSRTDAVITYPAGSYGGNLGIQPSSIAATDILVDGWHGRAFFGTTDNTIIDHASIGNFDACYWNGVHLVNGFTSNQEDGFRFWTGSNGGATPTNDTVRNSVIHDIVMGVGDSEVSTECGLFGNGPHVDCMQNNGSNNVTVSSNLFFNCPSSDIQWNAFSGATVGTELMQNNYFGPVKAGNGVSAANSGAGGVDCSGITIRNNFFDNAAGINTGGPGTYCTLGAVQAYGNYFSTLGACAGVGVNYHDNAFQSGGCGTATKVCTPTFVSRPPAAGQLLLGLVNPRQTNGDTCLNDSDTAALFPVTDVDGNARPNDSATLPDFGLYETH